MDHDRPNPDMLLERVTAEERKRGHLKIYLGMAAGSGKTYAMLSDATLEKRRGLDVVAGYIEPHGRVETEQIATQIESLAFKITTHKGLSVREFDLDAALQRKPQILLVDELAHTNAPGSRHAKRCQDIEECLSHGINVWTTLNVQHVESLSDVVTKITGSPVHETVPDSVLQNASEIELIDVTPEELIQRLKDGKIYLPDKVDVALNHFFKPGNLLALRELVLRLTAERVDEQLISFRRLHDVHNVWPAKPRVMVCISPNNLCDRVIRTASRLAHSLHTELIALTVENLANISRFEQREQLIQDGINLAEELGAKVVRSSSDDVVREILRVARERNVSIVVVGKPIRSRLRDYLFGSIVDELIRLSGELDIYVITDTTRASKIPFLPRIDPPSSVGVGAAIMLTGLTTLFGFLVHRFLEPSNLVMLYLLAVAWAGSRLGRVESVITCVLSVLAFDFFFVPPYWTFAVSDAQYLVTFTVMLIIALFISSLTRELKAQAQLVHRREKRTAALYEVSKRLATATTETQIATIVKEKCSELFGCDGVLLLPNGQGNLDVPVPSAARFEANQSELAVAQWVAEHRSIAGAGTDTLAGSQARYIPLMLKAPRSAVFGICVTSETFDLTHGPLLEAFASQVGSALERLGAERQAIGAQVEMESERVRNVLLSSISHDFRSPLAAILGAADTLEERHTPVESQGRDLLRSIKGEANRLLRLVRNVLDLSRLEAGKMQLRLEWESLEELIGTGLERTALLLDKRDIEVLLTPGLPLIRVDALAMEQVFVNLFENIAKHTPVGTRVSITGRVEGSALVVEIADAGPGLPPGAEKKIFEKAFRGTTMEQGFGLGLTICQAIMNAHGGQISARTIAGGGACFTLRLPIPEQPLEVSHGS